jgi:hypothetical protein
MKKTTVGILAAIAALVVMAQVALPSYKLKLAWDASVSPSAVGYIVYSCTTSNGTFAPVVVTPALEWDVPRNMASQWFYATAYDQYGIESVPSSTVQGPLAPVKPGNPRLTK